MTSNILVADQGTTSTRSIVFSATGDALAAAQQEFPQHFPRPGWVEHDPEDLWSTTLATLRRAMSTARASGRELAGLGLTNQRETTLLWNRRTGKPIHNAIVWQDRRTADECARLRAEGAETLVSERSGLLIDPYFSATKIAWLLDNVAGARTQAERGELAFGTVDSFLLWRLTNGAVHATDATNASRTLLFNIHKGAWDEDLLRLFRVPSSLLPEVRDTAGRFGDTAKEHLGASLPILAMAGDQQSALVGQACFEPGMVKATYGTGAFVLLNTGAKPIRSTNRMLTTIAYQWGGQRIYALEGSIFSAGATIQWLRDELGVVATSAETEALAAASDPTHPIYIVPAFAGLGAPHWDSDARGAIIGLTRGCSRKELARAALESVGYQTRDLIGAMRADTDDLPQTVIRADGGMTANDWAMQFLADILDAPVDRPTVRETTALGAAFLAGWQAGLLSGPEAIAKAWKLDRRFKPAMAGAEREERYRGWRHAVARTILKPAG